MVGDFLLVIEARDGARCPGIQTIIVGTRSGRIYQGVCQASIAVNNGPTAPPSIPSSRRMRRGSTWTRVEVG